MIERMTDMPPDTIGFRVTGEIEVRITIRCWCPTSSGA
jgi:hypothetical protein